MKTDKIIRMRLRTFRKLRQVFPAERGETADSYFSRLAESIWYNKMWEELRGIREQIGEELK